MVCSGLVPTEGIADKSVYGSYGGNDAGYLVS